MTRKGKVILAACSVIVLVGACAIAYVVATTIFWSGMCDNDNVTEVFSPDEDLKAVTFRRNCGATTGYSTHLSILKANQQVPNDGGNVLVLDGEPDLEVAWRDRWHVSVSSVAGAETFKRETKIRDVEIVYE